MATMMASLYYGARDIRVQSVPRPVPSVGEVLVRVHYCGICGSDLRTYQKGSPPGNLPLPRILGHEFAGRVVAVGEGLAGFSPGDRVAAAPATSCGHCFYCRRGATTLCLNALDFGTTQAGAQAEYVVIPSRLIAQGGLLVLPEDISYSSASLLEPLGTCLHGLRTRAGLQRGETVVIIGDGPIGLLQVMLARYLGAGRVICAGHYDQRLARAASWGAHTTVNTHVEDLQDTVLGLTEKMGADLVVVSVPNPQALQEAFPLVRGGGRVVVFGGVPKGSKIEFEPNFIHYREVTITGAFNCTAEEFRQALSIARELPLDQLITQRVPLSGILDGYRVMAAKTDLKVLVEMLDHQSVE